MGMLLNPQENLDDRTQKHKLTVNNHGFRCGVVDFEHVKCTKQLHFLPCVGPFSAFQRTWLCKASSRPF